MDEQDAAILVLLDQQVQIHDAMSTVLFLLLGLPQVSVLGPISFLIYILPLVHLIRSHGLRMHSYSEDAQLYLPFQYPNCADAVHNVCMRFSDAW